ncbi:MAG TPA: SprT family zinc-dependent metalloprotease [Syntrophales bacterium]|nr:SprT family zinc-dependent metalloprotease [Syntrophales bacterium]
MNREYTLIRSRKRKRTLSLVLTRTGEVVVRSPYGVSAEEIDVFVESRRAWLNRKKAELTARAEKTPSGSLTSGERALYLGVSYSLSTVENDGGQKDALTWTGDAFHLLCRNALVGKELFKRWYAEQARHYFPVRVAFHSAVMGVAPSSIRVSSARSRFGSCTAGKRISLSWRLMMAPPEVIDSVIIHELGHLRELNHSPRFWSLIRQFCPDYDRHKLWLRTNGRSLVEF